MHLFIRLLSAYRASTQILERLAAPLLLLGMRIYLGYFVFFQAGLIKTSNWEGTLWLFGAESWQEAVDLGNYYLPLPTWIAAALGTVAELVLSLLLLLGVLGHLNALLLLLLNFVAVAAFPALYYPELHPGFYDHMFWGVMLATLTIYGPGKYSLDTILEWRLLRPESLQRF